MQECIEVDNVKCGGCVKSIQTVLGKLAGVAVVEVDIATGAVNVDGESLDREHLINTLTALGFPEK